MVVVPLPCDQEREVEREGGGERHEPVHRPCSSIPSFTELFLMDGHATRDTRWSSISLELKLVLLGGDLIQRVRGGRVGERVK